MPNDIPNQDLPVKEEKQVRIQRGKHDKEHPYANISKKMLRDISLSPRDKGALCYLLSLPDNWEAHPRQVAEALGISKNQMYDILKCLIQKGYASKEEIKSSKGRFCKVVYYFYEEKQDQPITVKENSTVSQNPDTDNPDTEKGTLKNIYYKENIPEGINNSSLEVPKEPAPIVAVREEVSSSDKTKRTKPDFSHQVRDVATKMLAILEKHTPVYRPPSDMTKFLLAVQLMIEKEKQDPLVLLQTFEWGVADNEQSGEFSGWQGVLATNNKGSKVTNPAEIFHRHYSKIHSKMRSKPKRKFAPSSDQKAALAAMEEMNRNAL